MDEKKGFDKKAYHREYYLKRKFTKQQEGNGFFRKLSTASVLITRRKNIEKALRDNEEKARLFKQSLEISNNTV